MRRPAALCCLSFTAALLMANLAGARHSVVLFLFCSIGVAVCIPLCRRLRFFRRWPLLILIPAGVAFLWYSSYELIFYQPAYSLDGETAVVTGVVAELPEQRENYTVLTLRVKDVEHNGSTARGKGLLNLYVFGAEIDADVDDKVTFTGSLRLPREGEMGFNAVRYYRSRVIYLTTTAEPGDVRVEPASAPHSLYYYATRLRLLIHRGLSRHLEGDALGLAAALLYGQRSGIGADVSRSFTVTGMSHALAVSGMNLSFLATVLFFMMEKLRMDKRISYGVVILCSLLYMSVSGFAYSVLRAGIMIILLYLGRLLMRDADAMTSLLIAAAGICAVNPFAVMDVGLQLSVTSTAGLLLFTKPLYQQLLKPVPEKGFIGWAGRGILGGISVTLSALSLSLPLICLYFGGFSPVSVVSNLLTLWAIQVMFFGAIGLAVLSAVPGISWLLALVVKGAAAYVILMLGLLSRVPGAWLPVDYPFMLPLAAGILTLFILWFILRRKGARLRTATLCSLLLVAISWLSFIVPRQGWLSVALVNVGQGDAIAIVKDGRAAVVDCGSSSINNPEDYMDAYLRRRGVSSIDALILTHYDSDHAGGVDNLLNRFTVHTLYVPDYNTRSRAQEDILTVAGTTDTRIFRVEQDLRIELWDGLTLTLYTRHVEDFINRLEPDYNNASMVVMAQYKGSSFLLTGDLGREGEQWLLSDGTVLDADILKVGHHGSRYAATDSFLREVTPAAAGISVGRNTYGHPTDEVLERLSDYTDQVYRTDENGTVEFFTKGEGKYRIVCAGG